MCCSKAPRIIFSAFFFFFWSLFQKLAKKITLGQEVKTDQAKESARHLILGEKLNFVSHDYLKCVHKRDCLFLATVEGSWLENA